MVLGFPSRSWPSCKQPASLSILQHYSQLYSQTWCPEQLGVMVQELSRLGAAAQAPLAPSPQGGSGKSPRCVGPGESDAPQKKTLHPEGSRGRSHNEPSPCRRKQRMWLVRAALVPEITQWTAESFSSLGSVTRLLPIRIPDPCTPRGPHCGDPVRGGASKKNIFPLLELQNLFLFFPKSELNIEGKEQN